MTPVRQKRRMQLMTSATNFRGSADLPNPAFPNPWNQTCLTPGFPTRKKLAPPLGGWYMKRERASAGHHKRTAKGKHLRVGTEGKHIHLGRSTQGEVGDAKQAVTAAAVDVIRLRGRRHQVADEPAVVGELAHTVVPTVRHDQSVALADGDALWPQQAAVAVSPLAVAGHQLAGGRVEQLQSVVARVGHDDAVV